MANSIANLNVRLGFIFDQKSLDRLQRTLQGSAQRLSRIGTDLSLTLSAPLGALGVASIRAAGDLESLENALKSQLGSAEAAKKELELLRQEALKPGLGFEQAVKGSVSLQAVGFSADFARKTLAEFGNALAIAGKGKAELDGVALALTQISAKGIVSAEEINQIAERLPQIRTLMKQAFGTASTEELQKLGITAQQFTEGIVKEMEKLPRATGGIKNSIENAGDAVTQFLGSIGREINTAFNLTELSESLSKSLKGAADAFAGLDDSTKRTIVQFGLAVVAAGPLIKVYGALVGAAGQLIGVWSGMAAGLSRLGAFVTSTATAFNALNLATKAFVVIGVATAVLSLANNMGAFNRELTATEKAQQLVNDVQREAVSSIASEKAAVDTLIAVINSEVSSRDAKARALDKLKSISPEYFGQLKEEGGLVNGLTESYGRYVAALLNSARAEAAKGKLVDIEKQLLELEDGRAAKLKENTALALAYGKSAGETAKRESEIYNKQIGELNAKKQALAAVVIASENNTAQLKTATPAVTANTSATVTATQSAKALAAAKREKTQATKDAKAADDEETASMERYAKMIREIEQAWLDEAKAEVDARAASVGATDTSTGAPGGEVQLGNLGANVATLPPALTASQLAMQGLNETALSFKEIFSGGGSVLETLNQINSSATVFGNTFSLVSEQVAESGTLMQSIFLGMGAAMSQAATGGASSFAELASAALASAGKIVKAFIQQGVAATVAKALNFLPFPFNLAAGAAAGAAASALFSRAISSISVPGFAKGTKDAPGGLALVGERGAELINLPKHSQVYNANQTSKMLSGMGGDINLGGEFTVRGTDLVLVLENTQRKNSRFR